jgi:hypothetical protein
MFTLAIPVAGNRCPLSDPTPVPADDPFDNLAGITKRPALPTRAHRQQISDQRPLRIRKQSSTPTKRQPHTPKLL